MNDDEIFQLRLEKEILHQCWQDEIRHRKEEKSNAIFYGMFMGFLIGMIVMTIYIGVVEIN